MRKDLLHFFSLMTFDPAFAELNAAELCIHTGRCVYYLGFQKVAHRE